MFEKMGQDYNKKEYKRGWNTGLYDHANNEVELAENRNEPIEWFYGFFDAIDGRPMYASMAECAY